MLFHRFDRPHAEAYALANLATLERSDGRRDAARAALDESLVRFRRLRDDRGEALALAALGNHARSFGEADEAVAKLEQARTLRQGYGDRRALGMTENGLALALAHCGDLAAARDLFASVHDRFRAADDAPGQGGVLITWGLAEEHAGEIARAAELFAGGAEIWEQHLGGQLPGWGWLTTADAYTALGEDIRAEAALRRAERLFEKAHDTRGSTLCTAHPVRVKTTQSSGKAPPP